MIGTDRERESENSVQSARLDDNNDDDDLISFNVVQNICIKNTSNNYLPRIINLKPYKYEQTNGYN